MGVADAAAKRVGVAEDAPALWHEEKVGPDEPLVDTEHPEGSAPVAGVPAHVADVAQYCCDATPLTHTYLYDDDAPDLEQVFKGYDTICCSTCVVMGHVLGGE